MKVIFNQAFELYFNSSKFTKAAVVFLKCRLLFVEALGAGLLFWYRYCYNRFIWVFSRLNVAQFINLVKFELRILNLHSNFLWVRD